MKATITIADSTILAEGKPYEIAHLYGHLIHVISILTPILNREAEQRENPGPAAATSGTEPSDIDALLDWIADHMPTEYRKDPPTGTET